MRPYVIATGFSAFLAGIGCRSDATAPSTVPVIDAAGSADTQPVAGPVIVRVGGTIDAGASIKLDYYAVLLRDADGKVSGTLDIPAQGARGVALADVQLDGDRIAFSLSAVGAKWSGTKTDADTIECSFEQMGTSLPCSMNEMTEEQLAAALAPKRRPQHPEPPFPYEVVEVNYENAKADVTLAGTLTIPPGDGPFAAALLITGSGAQDRDETLMGHKPFLVIADHLTRHGIAVLRVDDRGVGGSSKGPDDPTSADFADDVRAGVEFLATQARIDPKRIGLIGHSEGGMIAPMVAAKNKKVAFVVLLAGPGVTGADLLVEQVGALAESVGQTEAEIAQAKAKQRQIVDIVASMDDLATAEAKLRELLANDTAGSATVGPDVGIKVLLSPWFRYFMRYDPRPTLRKVKCPVLVLNGELDRQVVASQNVPEIETALKKAGNRKVTVHRLAGLNHLFQTAKTGGIDEYERLEETFAPAALELMTTWITTETGAKTK